MNIFKICGREEWQWACTLGSYSGSPDDIRDGFIHLSTGTQLTGTLEKHFAGRSDLMLIAFDEAHLGAELKWEPSRGGEFFPHLYSALPTDAALWVRPVSISDTGRHVLPGEVMR